MISARTNTMFTLGRMLRPACWVLAASLWTAGGSAGQAGDIPRFDRNAVMLGGNGAPCYLVADMRAASFHGVPAVVGVWTDGIRTAPFVAIPTNDPTRWLWLTSNGPAGVIEFHPGRQPFATWRDNYGNGGTLITF